MLLFFGAFFFLIIYYFILLKKGTKLVGASNHIKKTITMGNSLHYNFICKRQIYNYDPLSRRFISQNIYIFNLRESLTNSCMLYIRVIDNSFIMNFINHKYEGFSRIVIPNFLESKSSFLKLYRTLESST